MIFLVKSFSLTNERQLSWKKLLHLLNENTPASNARRGVPLTSLIGKKHAYYFVGSITSINTVVSSQLPSSQILYLSTSNPGVASSTLE